MTSDHSTEPLPYKTVGRYELDRYLGQGGMSTVYLARDPVVKRNVAIKILPRQFTHDGHFRARFQREAEVIAALEHSYIVSLYDFGEEDGLPFIVMRYMPGGTLQQKLESGPLDLASWARVIARIGDALGEAHAQGIVHRDLKPANILFDARGEAYLSDFGIAKVSEATAFTGTGVIGTPEYMSPEQARGLKDLDGRSDVYSLGVVMFQALSGRLPFLADTPMGAAVAHLTEPIPRLTSVKPDLPKACDAIILCAMAKKPDDRYPTPLKMSEDVQRLASGHAINPNEAVHPRAPLPGRKLPPAVQQPPAPPTITSHNLLGLAPLRSLRGHTDQVVSIAFSPDGGLLASGSLDKTVRVWDVDYGIAVRVANEAKDSIWSVAFSPDGKLLAASGREPRVNVWGPPTGPLRHTLDHKQGVSCLAFSPDSKTLACGVGDFTVQTWNLETGKLARTFFGHTSRISSLAYMMDGRMLVSGALDGTIRFWNTTGLTGHLRPMVEAHTQYVWGVALSADGKWLAAGTNKSLQIWDAHSGHLVQTLHGHTSAVSSVAFSPDSQMLASGSADKTVRLWDVKTGQVVRDLGPQLAEVTSLAFSPGGRLLATSADDSIRLWGIKGG